MRRHTVLLEEEDERAIKTVRQRYGLDSDAEAMRLAVRVLAESSRLEIVLPAPLTTKLSEPTRIDDNLDAVEDEDDRRAVREFRRRLAEGEEELSAWEDVKAEWDALPS